MANNEIQQTPAPPEKLKQLAVFTGKWKIDGRNFSSAPNGPETPVSGEDNYQWLDGHYFLVSNWQHLTEGGGHKGTSVLGFDTEEKTFFTRNFDNLGFERRYVLEQDKNTWKFIGAKERAVRTYSDDGNAYTEHWELLTPGNTWAPLCVMNGKKI